MLTATVSPSAATGSVTFYNGTTVLGSGVLSSGIARLTTSLLPAGTGHLKARYVGSGSFLSSASMVMAQTVNANPSGTLIQAGNPIGVGSLPVWVAVGDFNGDGIQDVAIANGGSNNVTILLGNGSGGFSAAAGSPFAVGTYPTSIAVGDFNGDGIQDLAVPNRDNNVTVLLGNGSGGFGAAAGSPFAVGTNPSSVALGDFNGDGRTDLVASNDLSNNITILLGEPAGTGSVLTITGLTPPSATVGSPAFTLTVNGQGFASGAVVRWNGAALATTFVNSAQLTASVNANLIVAAGMATVTVMNLGGIASAPATFTITSGPQPLTITSGAPPNGVVNAAYGPFTLTASGGSGTYLWSVRGVPGLTVNGPSGVLSGTPTSTGILTLTVTLTDANNLASSISRNYSVTIEGSSGLTIITPSLPGGIQNQAYSASLVGSGGSGTYSWAIGGISGLTVNASTGAIVGSPTVSGNLTLTVTLSDALNPGAAPATRQYAVTVAFAPLSITTRGTLGKFAPRAAISRTFAAAGGSPAFTWSATGIPATLTLNPATGQITGNAPANPGNYSFLIRVSDTETPVASDSTTVTFSVLAITPARHPKR